MHRVVTHKPVSQYVTGFGTRSFTHLAVDSCEARVADAVVGVDERELGVEETADALRRVRSHADALHAAVQQGVAPVTCAAWGTLTHVFRSWQQESRVSLLLTVSFFVDEVDLLSFRSWWISLS